MGHRWTRWRRQAPGSSTHDVNLQNAAAENSTPARVSHRHPRTRTAVNSGRPYDLSRKNWRGAALTPPRARGIFDREWRHGRARAVDSSGRGRRPEQSGCRRTRAVADLPISASISRASAACALTRRFFQHCGHIPVPPCRMMSMARHRTCPSIPQKARI